MNGLFFNKFFVSFLVLTVVFIFTAKSVSAEDLFGDIDFSSLFESASAFAVDGFFSSYYTMAAVACDAGVNSTFFSNCDSSSGISADFSSIGGGCSFTLTPQFYNYKANVNYSGDDCENRGYIDDYSSTVEIKEYKAPTASCSASDFLSSVLWRTGQGGGGFLDIDAYYYTKSIDAGSSDKCGYITETSWQMPYFVFCGGPTNNCSLAKNVTDENYYYAYSARILGSYRGFGVTGYTWGFPISACQDGSGKYFSVADVNTMPDFYTGYSSNALAGLYLVKTGSLSCNQQPFASPICGNGIVEPGEQCDNGINNGACPNSCSSGCANNNCDGNSGGAVCGNGIVESDEQCDDGNVNSGDGCDSFCQNEGGDNNEGGGGDGGGSGGGNGDGGSGGSGEDDSSATSSKKWKEIYPFID